MRWAAAIVYSITVIACGALALTFGWMSFNDTPEEDDVFNEDNCVYDEHWHQFSCPGNRDGDGGPFGYGALALTFGVAAISVGVYGGNRV